MSLPGAYAMPVKELLFTSEKPTKDNLLGDGFAAYVVRVEPDGMERFIDDFTGTAWDWRKGKLLPGDMEAYAWVIGWMKDEEKARFSRVVNIDALIKKPDIVHRQEVKRNSSGDISNVRMWIIDSGENIVVFLNEDT